MNGPTETTIVNERHDYTGAALAVCLAVVAIGYFLTHRPTSNVSPPRVEPLASPSVTIASYELERTRLVELQNAILRLRDRYEELDPRMVRLRSELSQEIQVKLNLYKAEYEGSYVPLKMRASELSREGSGQ